MIVIGTTRKPTQRIRSFIKELNRVIPHSRRLTRGKQGFSGFCEEALDLGATDILLVGAFHGNPGRLGFLHYNGSTWVFKSPTILIKSVRLLREAQQQPPPPVQNLYVLPATDRDTARAQLIAQALKTPMIAPDEMAPQKTRTALLRINLFHKSLIEFLSPDQTRPVGPLITVKKVLNKAIGDEKRW